ncbi:ATP-binding protein [Dehalococcoides sp.]|jgi:PAS domain S-box-containing protein|uniref:PAS domain-containing sensor histidine kinase n=1 Tax=Dehalococcoides sp. TaxID=1966486 RepID=UPI003562593A
MINSNTLETFSELERLQSEIKRLKRKNYQLESKANSYRKKYLRYHAFFEISSDPFYITTYPGPPTENYPNPRDYLKQWKIIEVNNTATQIMGYSKKQLTSLSLGDIATHNAPKSKQTRSIIKELVNPIEKGQMFSIERDHIDRRGNKIEVEIKGQAVNIGGIKYIASLSRDISDRKKLEKEILKSYRLEKHCRQVLQKEIANRIDFTLALIHELKSPLTPILSSSEALLSREEPDSLNAELARNIYHGAKSLNACISELLDLAKSEISGLTLQRTSLLLNPLLSEIAGELTPYIQSHRQELILDLPEQLPAVLADPERIKQVLRNLLNNAVKYNREKGRITLKAGERDPLITISVHDQGRKIAQKDQLNLFKPYFRCSQDRARTDGLGIGLALSKQLVELHSGEIYIRSVRGKGTTVIFTLPVFSNTGRTSGK